MVSYSYCFARLEPSYLADEKDFDENLIRSRLGDRSVIMDGRRWGLVASELWASGAATSSHPSP